MGLGLPRWRRPAEWPCWRRLRLWEEDERLLVEVEDRGRIEEPLVGRIRPDVNQEGGRGLWLANQLCDLVQIRSGEAGTTVRLHLLVREAAFV